MQHNLIWVLLVVAHETFVPVVPDSICKDGAGAVECSGCDTSTDGWVALETMFRVLVPEMERAVATSSTKGSMLGMEGDIINCVNLCSITRWSIAMTFEGEIRAVHAG